MAKGFAGLDVAGGGEVPHPVGETGVLAPLEQDFIAVGEDDEDGGGKFVAVFWASLELIIMVFGGFFKGWSWSENGKKLKFTIDKNASL